MTTLRMICTFADEMLLPRKGKAQWKALIESDIEDDAVYSVEAFGRGENPYVKGRVYDVTIQEAGNVAHDEVPTQPEARTVHVGQERATATGEGSS